MVVRSARNTPGDYAHRAKTSFVNNQSAENNFIGGLKTEFTGLNFPENACTQVENCVFSLIGDVTRRGGFDAEPLNQIYTSTSGGAYTNYRWKNAGGDGESEILVQQTANKISFFLTSTAGSAGTGISQQILPTTILLDNYLVAGNTNPGPKECQYADGNGFLFIFHPMCNPLYVTYTPSTQALATQAITIQVRDFDGIPDNLGIQGAAASLTIRPSTLSAEHDYNIQNQGWAEFTGWSANSASIPGSAQVQSGYWYWNIPAGNYAFTVAAGITPTPAGGQTFGGAIRFNVTFDTSLNVPFNTLVFDILVNGVVASYAGTTLTLTLPTINYFMGVAQNVNNYDHVTTVTAADNFNQNNTGNKVSTWFSAIGNYPSNADIWWQFKNTSNVFAPTPSSIVNVTLANTRAPAGHFIFDTFFQDRTTASGIANIQTIFTSARPSTGAFFAGRVWYSGASDSRPAGNDAPAYTWTENIYYSQIITNPSNFGDCYSVNDPTDQTFFNALSTDGGVILIQGTGAIYKLFPITNGLLVMAQNGIWLITGSQGVGFDPTSYVVSKISAIKVLSASSIVDVLGLPFFWNLEGIYSVQMGKDNVPYGHGGLLVQPLTVGTILSFYNQIPHDSKIYAKAAYNPITYVIQWVYRSTPESNVGDRYTYDSALSLNIYNKAFYPYTIPNSENSIAQLSVNGIVFMDYPSSILDPQFKYSIATNTGGTYAEENDFINYQDFVSLGYSLNYSSNFTTGYKLHGQARNKWQPVYIYMYSRNSAPTSYIIQSVWDFSNTATGRTSTPQTIVNFNPNYGMLFRRHKLRGHGRVVQFKVSSIDGQPFDIMGWAVSELSNEGA